MPFYGVKNWITIVRDYFMGIFFSLDFEIFNNVTKESIECVSQLSFTRNNIFPSQLKILILFGKLSVITYNFIIKFGEIFFCMLYSVLDSSVLSFKNLL